MEIDLQGERFKRHTCNSVEGILMNEYTDIRFIILMVVVFPLLLLISAIYLQSNICAILAILLWLGIGVTMIYLPLSRS